jgi:hypothetical protein
VFPQPLLQRWTPKIIVPISRNTRLWKLKQNKDAVSSARRLIQYCQLPGNILAIFWWISGIFRGTSNVLIPRFLVEELTMFCGILAGKHWPGRMQSCRLKALLQSSVENEENHEKRCRQSLSILWSVRKLYNPNTKSTPVSSFTSKKAQKAKQQK